MKYRNTPRNVLGKAKKPLQGIQKLWAMSSDSRQYEAYWPTQERKSRAKIFTDLLWSLLRYQEIHPYYSVLGIDRKNGVNKDEYLPYRVFRNLRDRRNLDPPNGNGYNYVCILRDKFIFSQFGASLGFPTIKNLALCNQASITWLNDMRTLPLDTLPQNNEQFDGFCKGLTGIMGKGAFPLSLRNGSLFVNDTEITIDQLRERIDGQYLIQERIQQHPTMNLLHPSSVNTVRLITFNNAGRLDLLCAAQRIGTQGRNVDNWALGAIVVGIDLETGRLQQDGFYKPGFGGRVQRHPDTNVEFSGFEIPYFHDAVQLVTNIHRYLYGIHSVGWDVAITETGPVIVEGNDDWGGGIPMTLQKKFKQQFLAMYQR